jgi:hypothetical protein
VSPLTPGAPLGALTEASFGAPLTKAALRATSPDLDEAAFEAKWKASLAGSPVMFVRAWPGAYHADLARAPATSLPGREALCLGDAHPDNFGYLSLAGKTIYAYNDLDDSGYGPAIVDALRYFAIVRLTFGDDALTATLIETYLDGLKDPTARPAVDRSLAPDWAHVSAKQLRKLTTGGRLAEGSKEGLEPASPADVAAVKQAILALPALAGATVLDVGQLERTRGGSGGLARYWALAEGGGQQTVWELKQESRPGTELGRHTRTLDHTSRLATLKKAFWNTTTESDYVAVSLHGSSFVLRNRLAKKSVDLGAIPARERDALLRVQAGQIAAFHEEAMHGIGKDDLRPWLLASSRVVADRWRAFYQASGGK